MRTVELWSTWLFFCGAFAGVLIGSWGLPRHDLLVRGEATYTAPTIVVALAVPLVLIGLSVLHARTKAGEITPRLGTPRVRLLFYGAHGAGIALGLCSVYLWSMIGSDELTVGRMSNPSWGSAEQAWDMLQWVVFLAPPVVQIVVFIGGIMLMVRGGRDVKGDLAFVAETRRRRRHGQGPAGMRLTGQIVRAEAVPSALDQTLVVAQVQAPDGLRTIEATVPGTRRDWLPGAKAQVFLSTSSPYDSAQTLIEARRFPHATYLMASACPRAVSQHAYT
ncbi:hypothetical protein [Ruania alba]|uniref:Uncharacterized protein n=1 Tax=Ruania alba TaxID=648782 RepID=A0A1H5HVK7_9MICO|nr:hypothetical protein [Ruania alba]SEE32033.1 hypothetical protein SAMN04488554_2082 [Ruania alba]